jgi:hypothetical protein
MVSDFKKALRYDNLPIAFQMVSCFNAHIISGNIIRITR